MVVTSTHAKFNVAEILAHRAGRHRPEEPDSGDSGARRPKLGGKAVAPKRCWGVFAKLWIWALLVTAIFAKSQGRVKNKTPLEYLQQPPSNQRAEEGPTCRVITHMRLSLT